MFVTTRRSPRPKCLKCPPVNHRCALTLARAILQSTTARQTWQFGNQGGLERRYTCATGFFTSPPQFAAVAGAAAPAYGVRRVKTAGLGAEATSLGLALVPLGLFPFLGYDAVGVCVLARSRCDSEHPSESA